MIFWLDSKEFPILSSNRITNLTGRDVTTTEPRKKYIATFVNKNLYN